MQRCLLPSCAGCKLVRCGNCAGCRRKRGGCDKRAYAGDCQNAPKPTAPRRDPRARRAAVAKAPPPKPKANAQWSDAENEKAHELYAQGGRDRQTFGEALSEALNGSKSPAQCGNKYAVLKRTEPKQWYVFAYDQNDPKQHSKALIAALPAADHTLGEDAVRVLWEEKVQGMGSDLAIEVLKDAVDRVWNYGLGGGMNHVSDLIRLLSEAELPPSFLELKPPKRNTKAFRDAFVRLRLLAMNEKKHREAALNLLTGKTNKCDWGYLDLGQKRSDAALQAEMSKKSCVLVALAEGANPLKQLPKGPDMADIKTMSIWPAFEAVACDAKHATCPSYARQFRCATRGAFVTHPSRRALLANVLLLGTTQASIAGSVSAALLLRAAACGSSTGTTSSTAWRSLGACGRLFAWPAFAGCAMGASFTSATWCGRRSGGGG